MELQYKREFTYNKTNILEGHPSADCYGLSFLAGDNSNIYADLFLPKGEVKAVVLEVADYKIAPKDYLNLSRYALHGYAVCSLHVRGQIGKSSNEQSWSIYAPFLENDYFLNLYQDTLDLVSILEKEFSSKKIYGFGVGQGAACLAVASAVSKKIDKLFIANIDNCDFETIVVEDKDTGYYEPLRNYLRYNIEKEDEMFKSLEKIDVLSYAKDIEAEVYYGQSGLNPVTPLACQNKFFDMLASKKEIKKYRKFEKEVLQEHFFDEYVLRNLAQD
ncbi:acetylxylan esterase [Gemella sp. zg-570]|uniref:acetylxylan esterase n=1 Tax=Gemella sp. zg-570 TaxID=2840371 RepID=UPI001C0E1F63|nr:acetylxylan esterase [Gemella sp. zg-570]QWQ38831.1 acetylxylan esterase [Gemella sp. zg-570]